MAMTVLSLELTRTSANPTTRNYYVMPFWRGTPAPEWRVMNYTGAKRTQMTNDRRSSEAQR